MYALDRRKMAQHIYSILSSLRKTAHLLNVSHSTISRWIKNPLKMPYSKRIKVLKSDLITELLKITIKSNPFLSLLGFQKLIQDNLHISVSKELVRLIIKREGFTRKKARFYGEPKNLEETTMQFIQERNKFLQNGYEFVSIDEVSFGRNGINAFGYARKGQKLFVRKTTPRMTTTSVVVCAAGFRPRMTEGASKMRLTESKNGIVSRTKSMRAFNTESFLLFLQSLPLEKQTVILLDNVKFHHSKAVKTFVASKEWILLYTPPYSPWFNPIEYCFSIIKRDFYKNQSIDHAFSTLTEAHCQAFFNKSLNCSYLKN
jgi:transposase